MIKFMLKRIDNVLLFKIYSMDEDKRNCKRFVASNDVQISSHRCPGIINPDCIYLQGNQTGDDDFTSSLTLDSVYEAKKVKGKYLTALREWVNSFDGNLESDDYEF